MTNSIASSKCLPPVLTSGNYGMSQNRHIDESKEYIFVKLTDSAYRAVEEYQRNENAKRFNNGQCAKIQLIGNSGVIHFPTPDNGEGRKFGFAIDDIEGSLECIQQTENELDVLGSLPLRMRIHANDDVYDTTRTKMAIAEETEKSKCIREIKPNQTDIGRKVKKPAGAGSAPSSGHGNGYNRDPSSNNQVLQAATSSSSSNFLSNSNNRSKVVSLSNNTSPSNGAASVSMNNMNSSKNVSSSRSPNPTLLGGSTTTGSNSNRYNSPHNNTSLYGLSNSSQTSSALPTLTTASSLSSALTAGLHQTTHSCSNGYSSASSGSPPEISNSKSVKMSLSASSRSSARPPAGGGLQSNKSAAAGVNNKIPDISKRKLRERLIHLLALKPFKKPELYARLANEGIRDKDRLSISNTLKDIAALSRDNTYNLKRPMWNDVNENWPFYTEQETQQLKRRKPQNLTPPLSSDAGSSTSGQSPTSTHTGSPPPLVGSHSGSMKRASLERDPYEDGNMSCGVQAKKQRISHFKKDAPLMTTASIVGGGANARLTYGNSTSYGQHNSGRNSGATYSPHGSNNHVDSDNPNNTDLSYNVLDNVDDFMPHVEQQSGVGSGGYFGGSSNSRKSMHSNKNSTATNLKDKRSSNAGFVQQQQHHERTSNKELMMKKKSSASPTIYSSSFVPEKSSSSRGSNANSYQRHSPSYTQQQPQHHHKTSNSVIYSPKTQPQASPKDDLRTSNNSCSSISSFNNTNNNNSNNNNSNNSSNNGSSSSSNKYHHNQQQQQQSRSGRNSATANHSRTPTPPMAQQQPQHYQQQLNVASNHQHHAAQQQQLNQQESPPQQLHSSPTQQIAAAVSSYAAASSQTSQKHYDFSNYTPITSIEQRRHYKTEFESDYDEYRKLLAQIEGVSMRFRGLAERLENAHKGCPDYYNIKQQIVSEYERIRNEEALQREKQRFDYLHEKLAHIKQLVTDYDKTLTSASAAAQQQLMLQQQQQAAIVDGGDSCASQSAAVPQATNVLSRNTRLSPMVGENSHSPTTTVQYQQQQQKQHHAAETIQPSQPQQQLEHMPQYNGHAPAQAPPPVDSDSDDSSDSNDDDDDDSNDADSHDDVDDDEDEDDDEDIDNVRY